MVARISTSGALTKSLSYNEQKVQHGVAELIHAGNYLKEPDQMNFYEKKERFTRRNELNSNSQTNTFHAKLSFDPTEDLANEQMARIAIRYMEGLEMGEQPYLVYRHTDTDVPHFHIISTMIREDGSRIRDFNIGVARSEPTRKQIEEEFGLIRAEIQGQKVNHRQHLPVNQTITHGEQPTLKAIQDAVLQVTNDYNYTSVEELNAILRDYNIKADPGGPDSNTHHHKGLHYRLLDENGNGIGTPIKASSLHTKPTLRFLENKFDQNQLSREDMMADLKIKLDLALLQSPENLEIFVTLLEKEDIHLQTWKSGETATIQLTYVDHASKAAVNAKELGEEYNAIGLFKRFGLQGTTHQHVKNLSAELAPSGELSFPPGPDLHPIPDAKSTTLKTENSPHPDGASNTQSTSQHPKEAPKPDEELKKGKQQSRGFH